MGMPIGLVPVAEDQPFPGDDTEFNEESSSGDTTTPPGGFMPTGDLFPLETTWWIHIIYLIILIQVRRY